MKKMLLGLTAVFAMTVAVPAFAAEEAAKDEKPAKAEKKPKKGAKKDDKKAE